MSMAYRCTGRQLLLRCPNFRHPWRSQETILNRINVDIPRGTKASWMIKVGTLVQPLINLMRDRLLDHDIIQMDDECMDA
jgi:transposase